MTATSATAPLVEILLATFNGANFIEEQVESLLRQTYPNWRVVARDDGSTDDTVEILRHYAGAHPERFVVIADGGDNLGIVGNFSRLMEMSNADYLAFCDQDDVWLPDKLALSVERMHALERDHGPKTPLLVHTDLCTVDRTLQTISSSFWRYQGLKPRYANDFDRLLIHNVVTGCTMVINRSLKELALPIPADAKVHDWWIALVAASFGIASGISTPTMLYRQHGDNATGAKAFGGWRFFIRTVEFVADLPSRKVSLFDTWRQAKAFLARYQGELRRRHLAVLADVLAVREAALATRIFRALKHGGPPPEGVYWMAFAVFVPREADGRPGAPARMKTGETDASGLKS